MSDSTDGLISVLLTCFVIYPLTNKILASRSLSKKQAIWGAVAFLAAVAFGTVAYSWQQRGPNYYQILEVRRDSSPMEIKKAYKRHGLELHPDKNPSPEAADQFAAMKNAYDVLMDQEFRDIYNKLGPEAIRTKKRVDETQLLIEIAVFYVTYAILAYVLTLGKSGAAARSYIFTGEIAMLVLEVAVISTGQGNNILPKWFFPTLTDHEVIQILRSVFPAFMNGCRAICGSLYVDVEKQARDLMLDLQKGHNQLVLQLQIMQREMKDMVGRGGGGSGAPRLQGAQAAASRGQAVTALADLEERMQTIIRSRTNGTVQR